MADFSAVTTKELFLMSRSDPDAAAELDTRVYLRVIDLALEQGWKPEQGGTGKELYRHLARLVLAQHLDPSFWAACRSCEPGLKRHACSACRGTGSLLISEKGFRYLIGHDQYIAAWRGRFKTVNTAVEAMKNGRG